MRDWNFLGGILEEVHIHSTIVGKIWLTVLFIFRMLVLGVAAEDVWNDEQVDFICNTQQPGCRNVCYDRAFPVSLIRYWVLQVIFVSSPSLVYMGHAIYRLRALDKQRHCRKAVLRRELEFLETEQSEGRRLVERELRQLEQGKLNKAPLRGSLLRTYVAHVVVRSALEVGFMLIQHRLYGNRLDPLYRCECEPCPNSVDCFVSRPTEKSMFMAFMQVIAGLSLFLSLLEIVHLGYKQMKRGIMDYYKHPKDDLNDSCRNKFNKGLVAQQELKASIPAAPTGGYTFLLERKQANGPTSPLLIGSSCASIHTGSKLGQENGQSNSNSSGTQSPHEQKPDHNFPEHLQVELSDSPTLPVTDSISCTKLHCVTVTEGNPENKESGNGSLGTRQHRDSTCKRNKSPSTRDMSSDSHRSSASPPKRQISVDSSASSRRATDLQI